ncbi:MAG: heavy metal-responsive transcriptional regulator [Thermoleophilia bacterium]|nr:heavy metal-responsive transcriptional regulator [Thermoleophilia bacterium]
MRIGELAEATGLTDKTIRYYESIGLLPAPTRTRSGYRDYSDDAIDRLRFIGDAQTTGLSLTEITSILELKDSKAKSCDHTRQLLEFELNEIKDRITALESTRDELRRLIRRAKGLDPTDCSDPQRCQVIGDGIESRLAKKIDER